MQPVYGWSPETLVNKSKIGMPMYLGGPFYIQYGATASYDTSTTETSLFNSSSTTALGSLVIPAGALNGGNLIGSGNVGPGTIIRVRMDGTITDTGTPNLTVAFKLGSTVLSTTGALALQSITGTMNLTILFEAIVTAYSSTVGSIAARGTVRYGTTALLGVTLAAPETASTSLDTTVSKTLDVTATWGSSSASNAIVIKTAYVEMVN